MHAMLLQLCPTLCDHMDCNPPGSSVHGILQARILEWIAMPSSLQGQNGIFCAKELQVFKKKETYVVTTPSLPEQILT